MTTPLVPSRVRRTSLGSVSCPRMISRPAGASRGSEPGRYSARTRNPFLRAAAINSRPVFPEPPNTAIHPLSSTVSRHPRCRPWPGGLREVPARTIQPGIGFPREHQKKSGDAGIRTLIDGFLPRGVRPTRVLANHGSPLQSVITGSANPFAVKPMTGARNSTRLNYVPMAPARTAEAYRPLKNFARQRAHAGPSAAASFAHACGGASASCATSSASGRASSTRVSSASSGSGAPYSAGS